MTETTRPYVTGIVKVYRGDDWKGYRVEVWVPDPTHPRGGRLKKKRYKKTATLTDMKAWREKARRAVILQPAPAPSVLPPTGFLGQAAVYLEAVKAMPSLSDRRLHILDWVAVFGSRTPDAITSTEIRAQRDHWLTRGPRRERQKVKGEWRTVLVPKPLAPHSVNLRLRALENLWTVLWPTADNPVREVPECDEPEALDRGTSFDVIQEILAHMPERTRPVKGVEGSRKAPSQTRARIAVMLWTGLAHKQLADLDEAVHVDYATSTYLRPRRKKGRRGTRNRAPKAERPQPLLPPAVVALKHFFAIGAAGPFSRSSLYKSFKCAIRNANAARLAAHQGRGVPALIPITLRPYDVKHTFGGEAYRASKDLRAVQELLGLSRIELADRYAHAAVAPAAAEAAHKLAARAAETSPTNLPSTENIRKSA